MTTRIAHALASMDQRINGPIRELPSWLWLWLPLILVVIQHAILIYDRAIYYKWIDGELGLVELATPALLTVSIIAGLCALRYRTLLPDSWPCWWIVLVTLGCFYFAGEELSWGQHLIGWDTPKYIRAINDQGETNLHNVSSWLDQKPRLLLELWVLTSGIVYPLRRFKTPLSNPARNWRYWFWPTHVCLPAALLAIIIRLPDRIRDWFNLACLSLEIRYSETQEYYFSVFLMLYLLSIWFRLRQLDSVNRSYLKNGLSPPP